jgi:hypothetical protein
MPKEKAPMLKEMKGRMKKVRGIAKTKGLKLDPEELLTTFRKREKREII